MIFVGADKTKFSDTERDWYITDLLSHSKGEYKRAIKSLRELQSDVVRLYGDHANAYYEETIAFIRRDLMGKAAAV